MQLTKFARRLLDKTSIDLHDKKRSTPNNFPF